MQHVDKIQHLTISLGATVVLVLLLAKLNTHQAHHRGLPSPAPPQSSLKEWLSALRYPLAFALVYTAGALKEVGDQEGWWPGNLDLADLMADLAGCVLGLVAARCIEQRQRWVPGQHGGELPV